MARHAQSQPSKKDVGDEWRTPGWVFYVLNEVFQFTLDAAATPKNAKCARYFAKFNDGLQCDWAGESVFVNPPFTGGAYGDWIQKAVDEMNVVEAIAQVLPFNAETKAFEPIWDYADYLILPYKRIAFDYPDGTPSSGPDAYHVIAVFSEQLSLEDIQVLQKIGRVLDLNHGLGQDRVVRYTDNFK